MSRWIWDEWDDDHPAVRRGREALAYVPPPERVSPPPPTRRDRIAELVARVRGGDAHAADELSAVLDEPSGENR